MCFNVQLTIQRIQTQQLQQHNFRTLSEHPVPLSEVTVHERSPEMEWEDYCINHNIYLYSYALSPHSYTQYSYTTITCISLSFFSTLVYFYDDVDLTFTC